MAPADGKVVFAGECVENRILEEKTYKISIFMSIFNVHINRIPLSGRIMKVYYTKGKFLSANLDKSSVLNEHNALLLETDDNRKVLFVQIAGLIARRIVCWISEGDRVLRGQRFGLICFGSRVDIFLPLDTEIDIQVGQRVKGGETILGYMS